VCVFLEKISYNLIPLFTGVIQHFKYRQFQTSFHRASQHYYTSPTLAATVEFTSKLHHELCKNLH